MNRLEQARTSALPPRLESPGGGRAAFALAAVVGAVAAGAWLYAFHPAEHRWHPICLFHAVTGLHCPGCGGTRAMHHLLHGDLAAAFRCNALLVLAIPATAMALVWRTATASRRPRCNGRVGLWLPWALLAVATVFGVLRNLPAFAWLSP
jgi:hypothetical protein